MKVLILSYDNQFINGEEVYIGQIISSLRERGHNVHNIILTEKINDSKYPFFNTKLIYLHNKNKTNFNSIFSGNIINLPLYFALRKEILRFNPDIIHINNVKFVKTVILASRGFPKVQTIHEFTSIFPLYLQFFQTNSKNLNNTKINIKTAKILGIKKRTVFFDYMIFGDKWIKKSMINYFLCPSKYLTGMCKNEGFKNVIYLPHFQEVSNKSFVNTLKDKDYVLFVGRLDKVKGVDYLLNAFRIIHEKNKSLKLIVIGDGPEISNLKKLSLNLGIDEYVNFLGIVNHSDIWKYYERAIAVVIPSIYPETGPLVALEAMKYSKPIVAFNVGGLPDLVEDDFNGFLVERFDIEDLSNKMLLLSKDKRLSISMGENGLKMLEKKWPKDKHMESLINIYRSAMLNTSVKKG